MSALVAQHQQTSFATPVNGAAGDATVVLGNDNATVATYNSHDADGVIHVQSSTAAVFAATPAGTAGRKWMTTDTGGVYLYYDTGSAWVEVNYARVASTGAVTVTSASAHALSVGLNGATNPAFNVDSSVASQVAGLNVVGAVTGGTVAVAVTDSGSSANLTVNAKATGTIGIGSISTGRVTITPVTTITGSLTLSAALVYGGVTLSNAVTGTGNMVLSVSPTFTGTVAAAIANFSGLVTANAGLTVASGQTLTLTGATITGAGSFSAGTITATFVGNLTGNVTGNASGTAATVTGATQAAITTAANLTTIGTLIGGAVPASLVTSGTFASGAFAFQGAVSVQLASQTAAIKLAQFSDATTYSLVSLNGVVTAAGSLGIAGGGGTDKTLYFQSAASGGFQWNIANVSVGTLSSAGALALSAGISATTGAYSDNLGTATAKKLGLNAGLTSYLIESGSGTIVDLYVGGAKGITVTTSAGIASSFTVQASLVTVGSANIGSGLAVGGATPSSAGIALANATPGSLADGQIWWDGTNYKGRVGGVTKTFTVT